MKFLNGAGGIVLATFFAQCLAGSAIAQTASSPFPPAGQLLYRGNCASCHDNSEATLSPSRSALSGMSFQTIEYALTRGKMRTQGSSLTEDQRVQLITYLTGKSSASTDTWSKAMMCSKDRLPVNLPEAANVSTFGYDRHNTRTLTEAQAGLDKAAMARLELAWAVAFPEVTIMRSQAAVVGDNLFLPVAEAGALYAFDIADPEKPCLQWIYRTPSGAPLRTSAAYGVLTNGTPLLAFSGFDSTVYGVDARTGKALWTKNVALYSYSLTTGTPQVLRDRVIVPVSQYEIMEGGNDAVTCCTNHGLILSLNPRTGDQQWRYDTMPDAELVRDRGDGKPLMGPSGAPIWNSPVIDEKRGLIYFGTGEANSPPAHRNTDALIAIRLKDGTEAWSFQATPDDIFNVGCDPDTKPLPLNCAGAEETVYRDVDFGASAILARLSDGRELLVAGQKSGTIWALDPDNGQLVWRRDIGTGSPMGGIHWGIAYDSDTIFAPISRVGESPPGGPTVDPNYRPGLYAVDARTGKIRWSYAVQPACGDGRRELMPSCDRSFGFSGAPTVIDGAVVQGGLDGRVFILDASSGKEIWTFDTLRAFDGINGVQGRGGALDNASIIAAKGLLILNSGYGYFGQTEGNVMLAFRPKR